MNKGARRQVGGKVAHLIQVGTSRVGEQGCPDVGALVPAACGVPSCMLISSGSRMLISSAQLVIPDSMSKKCF